MKNIDTTTLRPETRREIEAIYEAFNRGEVEVFDAFDQVYALIERDQKGIDLDALQVCCEKTLVLLEDRQPGLATWNGFLSENLQEMRRLIGKDSEVRP